MDEVRGAVDKAKDMMAGCGIDVEVTAEQLWDWFETDLPAPDDDLEEIIVNPLIVVHELVEIDQVLKMGLAITKDVIIKNPGPVDDAHLTAARIELQVARAVGAADHVRERIGNIEKWCVDRTLTEGRRAEYRHLLAEAKSILTELTR
jgi:hypothetical protein